MRKMLSVAAVAALLLAPTSAFAISQNKQDKLDKLNAREAVIQNKTNALQQKYGSNPTPAQQARLDKLNNRYAALQTREDKVLDRANKSN